MSGGRGSRRFGAFAVTGLALGLLAGVGLAAAPPDRPPSQERDECLTCHEQLEESRLVKPTRGFAQDVHFQRGLSCSACHGGDPNDPELSGMDAAKGFRGKPARPQIAEFCARCHADAAFMKRYNPRPYIFSLDEFRTSVHCKKISEGDERVATCTNCHGVHGILSSRDPASPVFPKNVPATCASCHNATYMKGRKVPTDQFALWSQSVHGKALIEKGDLSAPACNDCHGNHGAAPPGLRDVTHVCGSCHGREAELFNQSPVKAAMEHQGKGACVACHSNHGIQHPTDALLSSGADGLCGKCHVPGSPGDRGAREIVTRFAGLEGHIVRAESLLALAERRGMDVQQGQEALREARDQRVTVRAVLHSFDPKQIGGVLAQSEGFAAQGAGHAEKALRDWRARRIGMVVSLGVILVMIGLLVVRIRSLEADRKP